VTASGRNARYIVFLLFLAYAFSFVDRQILSILFEPIKADLGLSDTALGFLGGLAFAMTYSILGVPLAMLADRRGRKAIITASLTVFSAMTVLCGMATNFFYLALARVGVGIGEAGVNPASQSIVADLYPPEKRSTPMSVIATGAPIGMMFGLIGGGLIAGEFGWRMAFFVVGVPGVILAVIMGLTLREPERGQADQKNTQTLRDAPSLLTVLKFMWQNPAPRYLLIASTLAGVSGYGVNAWFPAFFMRTHDLTIGQVGLIIGLVGGTCGILGALIGGWSFDRLSSTRSTGAALKVIGIVLLVAYPISLALYFSGNLTLATALLVIPAMSSSFFLGPSNALMQGLVNVRMRAVASSISMLATNLIGLGLGPQVVGILSDVFRPTFGEVGLAYALACVGVVACIAAVMFFITANHADEGLEKAARET